ncbi:CRTAC1 family protein [Candidatus Poribacteria bacterium]|nr:CRTAC1 family protein [Candidatus Poribacteria bacterium]
MKTIFFIFFLLLFISNPSHTVPLQFTSVTKEASIHFKHHDGSSGQLYFIEPLGAGAAFLDYNNDGFQDIYLVNGADLPPLAEERLNEEEPPRNALYRNNGDGTFTDVAIAAAVAHTGYGMGCAVGDYNNDGFSDLYVTNFRANVFFHNNGDGTFTDATAETGTGDTRWGASCAFVDYDNDGFLDLYVTNYVKYTIESDQVCMNKGVRVYCDPRLYEGELDALYHNNGDGTFTDVTESAGFSGATGRGLALAWGDYDDDGDMDVYIANDADQNFLYRNNDDGTFTDVSLTAGVGFSEDGEAENGMGADFGDYDNDGRLDLVVTNFQDQTNTLYHNEENGLFSDMSYASQIGTMSLPYLAWGVSFCDCDNDGYQDLFIANGHLDANVQAFNPTGFYEQPNLLFHNNRDGTFDEVGVDSGSSMRLEKVSRGFAYSDYDNDGDLDLLVTNLKGTPDLLQNRGGQNTWLILKLIGTHSNRDAIGARVKVITGNLAQIREVRSGSSYLSQNDMRLHFGLGKHRQIDRVEIRWPSGLQERLEGVEVNQTLTLIEGTVKSSQ